MTKIMLFQGRSVVNFSGGAEKVLCNMSNALSSRGFEVLTVCDEFRKGTPFYKLDQNVRFCNLSARTGNLLKDAGTWLTRRFVPASFRLQRFLKREKPEVIVCYFISDVYRIKFLQRVKSPIILMQHCYPDFYFQKMKKFNYWLNLFLLRNVAAIKLASYKLDTAPREEINALLRPLIEENGSWSNIAREMTAMAAIRDGNTEEARALYNTLLQTPDLPESMKLRVQDMLSVLDNAD